MAGRNPHAIGLGSCWVQVRARPHDDETSASDYVKRLLDLPGQIEVEAVIGVGYPAEEKPGWTKSELLWERISRRPGPA